MNTPPIDHLRKPAPPARDEVTTTFETGSPAARDVALPFLQPSSTPGAIGRIGHYEVLEVVGRGGFGIVLRAFDDVLHRVVAIKVLSPEIGATSPARRRFLREARASAAVRHENVVQVHAIEETPLPYLVMEYIPGETLQQRMDACGPLSPDVAACIGAQIARGLAAAHTTGLIHRDVKPGNVLLERGPEERVKLTDFGLARAADDASLTQSGVVAGTPMYMAPEQARGDPLDHRSDLFSLGSVLYAMCTGRPPFRAENTLAVMRRVADDTPRPIRQIIPEVPQWLCDVIARLHAKDPAQRIQTAQEVAELLTNGQASPPLIAPPAVPARSQRKAALITGLSLVTLVAIAAVYYATRGDSAADKGKGVPPVAVAPVPAAVPLNAPPRAKAPFTAEEARAHQEAWAKYLSADVVMPNSLGMKMVLIPPGEFLQGSTPEQQTASRKLLEEQTRPDPKAVERLREEGPQHRVVLTKPFLLGATEVTVAQFRQFVEATNYVTETEVAGFGNSNLPIGKTDPANTTRRDWRSPGPVQTDVNPVCQITWNDACAFCVWLSKNEKLTPWYRQDEKGQWLFAQPATGYRLPFEAEWEYACRAGTTTLFSFGDDPAELARYAWWGVSSAVSRPIGTKLPNPFGLYDMHGGVSEFCQDNFAEYRKFPVIDPFHQVNNGGMVVNRGGNWSDGLVRCTSASRISFNKTARYWSLGFRVMRPFGGVVAEAEKQP